jgi:flagellar biosynthesis chaperone FliJ
MFTTNESKVGYEIALEGFAGTAWKYLQAGIKALVDLITKLINWLFFGSRGNKKQSERDYKAYSNELSSKINDVASDIESLKRDYEAAVKDLDDEKQRSETYKDLHEKTKKLLDQERLENQPALTNEFTGIKDKNPNFTWYVNKYYEEQQANSKQGLPMDVRDLLEGRNQKHVEHNHAYPL